jgi:Holliday junction resolvase RusA-like endonuclease
MVTEKHTEPDRLRLIVIKIDPVSAPRQVRSDAWRKRPVVLRYREFRDELNRLIGKKEAKVLSEIQERGTVYLEFGIPVSDSWSNKKKLQMTGTPHQQKPDIDNLVKAFLDAVFEEDSFVWSVRAHKRWSDKGYIVFGI